MVEDIEQERRKREGKLILLLLLLMDESRQDLTVAVKHGFPVYGIIQSAMQTLKPQIAKYMASMHVQASAMIFQKHPGLKIPVIDAENINNQYLNIAKGLTDQIGGLLFQNVVKFQNDTTSRTPKEIIRAAFEAIGFTKTVDFGLESFATRAIVQASNIGLIQASVRLPEVKGLHHVSVVDDRTTVICMERSGLKLPIFDPYWWFNIPPLHYRCRSIILPVFGEFDSGQYPQTPPAPGWGEMPPGFIDSILRGRQP